MPDTLIRWTDTTQAIYIGPDFGSILIGDVLYDPVVPGQSRKIFTKHVIPGLFVLPDSGIKPKEPVGTCFATLLSKWKILQHILDNNNSCKCSTVKTIMDVNGADWCAANKTRLIRTICKSATRKIKYVPYWLLTILIKYVLNQAIYQSRKTLQTNVSSLRRS